MFKFVASLFLVGILGMSAFAGNCHVQQVQAVIAQPVVTYVQPVRQQFVEVHAQPVVQFQVAHHGHAVVQQQVVVQKVVNGHHNNVQAVKVQKVVVNQPRVQRSRTVIRSR